MAHQTIEEYMAQTNDDYGLGIVWPYFKNTVVFKLKGQFLKKLCENTLSGKESEDAYEHVKKVLKIIDLFHEPSIAEDLLMSCVFSKSFTGQARRWLKTILTRSITMCRVGCEIWHRPHLSKDCPIKKDGKSVKEVYYGEYCGRPYQNIGREERNSTTLSRKPRASTNATLQKQGNDIKVIEMQLEEIAMILQERMSEVLPNKTKATRLDQVKQS
ncbi:hypothetical protein Tco_0011730 [Tanacetum coccineum]